MGASYVDTSLRPIVIPDEHRKLLHGEDGYPARPYMQDAKGGRGKDTSRAEAGLPAGSCFAAHDKSTLPSTSLRSRIQIRRFRRDLLLSLKQQNTKPLAANRPRRGWVSFPRPPFGIIALIGVGQDRIFSCKSFDARLE